MKRIGALKTALIIAVLVICVGICAVAIAVISLNSGSDNNVSDSSVSEADIVINEVLSSNSGSAQAFDGRYYDWVELYNLTADTVSLDGYYLSDDIDEPEKCSLAGQEISPEGYLIVYCSGLNITDEQSYLHTNFKLSATNGETLYLYDGSEIISLYIPAAEENVSYGLDTDGETYVWFDSPTPGAKNGDSGTISHNDVIINEYMISNTFTIYDCEGDYGDWVELYNSGSESADMSGYAITDDDTNPFKYVFAEGTTIAAGEYLLIFCDGKDKVDDSGVIHTGFSLSVEDGAITLYTPEGVPSDSIEIVDMPDNISCGLVEGESEPKLFARPTPGKQNSTSWTELSAQITPDINDGVLISETLAATSSVKGKYSTDYIEIYNSTSSAVNLKGYTLSQTPNEVFFTFPDVTLQSGGYILVYCDGTYKTGDTSDLHAPVKISTGGETFYLANASGRVCDVYSSGKSRYGMSSGRIGSDITQRVFFSTPTPGKENSGEYYTTYAPVPEFSVLGGIVKSGTVVSLSVPDGYTIVYTTNGSEPTIYSSVYTSPFVINDTTVIRAAAFSNDSAISDCATNTYFVENPHTIPIVCISGREKDLTGDSGILMDQSNGAEYQVHVEYFDENGEKAVEFECGAQHFGAYSLSYDQKGIKLSLREIYGQNEVSYNFFNENDEAATTFSSLLLRPSGQDQTRAKLRDELIPAIVRGQIDIDYQEYRACALYVDGEYWGLYYIREHLNGDYLETYYGYEEGTYDLIKSQMIVQEGSLTEYTKLTYFCKQNDLTIQENYDYVCSIVDIDSLISYWIIETYFANSDTGNIRCYKSTDGKWRWMIYDFDWAMFSQDRLENVNYIYEHCLDPEGHGAAHFDNSIIRKLLANEDFQARFITTYCYYIQTVFNPERTVPILTSMANKIDNEIQLNEERWGKPDYDRWKDTIVPFLQSWLELKPDIALQQLKESFDLTDDELAEYVELAGQISADKYSLSDALNLLCSTKRMSSNIELLNLASQPKLSEQKSRYLV